MPSTVRIAEEAAAYSQKQAGTQPRRWQWSYVAIAIAAIVGIDCAARVFYHPDRFNSPNRSWAWWATTAYNRRPKADVAVFGSSLMLAAVNDGDATFLKSSFDAVQHHQAVYLENLLSQKLGRPVSTTTLAIGGQMASDVYVLARNLFTTEKTPPVVIWGIAPRDFVDSSFTDADNSETVRYFKKVTGSTNVLGRHRHLIWTDIETNIGRAFYLYGKRQDLTADAITASKAFLGTVCGAKELDRVRIPKPLLRIAMQNIPEDNGLKQWQVTPYSRQQPFDDNTEEYKQRYTPFRPRVFATQVDYLNRFLLLAKEKGIHVIIVNMPITNKNLKLLPNGVYENYLQTVSTTATNYGAQYVDLNQPGMFPAAEFADTVHLNGLGGMRFFQKVAQLVPAEDLRK